MTSTDPEAAFRGVAGAAHERMFWLDGGGSREWSGRRSVIGWLEPDDVSLTYDAAAREVWEVRGDRRTRVGDDVFTVLADRLERDGGDPDALWVGWFGYACRPDLPARTGSGVPDAVWMRASRRLVYEHTTPVVPSEDPPAGGVADASHDDPDTSAGRRVAYGRWFDRVQEQLRLGNTYEVNLTYRESVASDVPPVEAYLRLRRANPAPYAAFLRHGGVSVLSSSPERFATIDGQGWVETRPIKGTTPRGATPAEDAAHREALRSDPRYRAENLMIVDLLRNDLSMVCEPGTVSVPALMEVESYASVHQLVSTVRGRLREGIGTMEALRALFPAGSMTGAPKLRTMQVISDVETTPRGVYAGALGWISGDGRADLGVVIRTLVAQGGTYTLGTGGGITVRSDTAAEYDETRWKAARLLRAVR